MQYSVIYSFDITHAHSVMPHKPPHCTDLWEKTEGDEQYEFDYLADGGGRNSEGFRNGKHRKYCAILNQAQFDEFVGHCDLDAEPTETMGSIGTPGFGGGWAPAISFQCQDTMTIYDDNGVIYKGAYVTPVPEPTDTEFLVEDGFDWEKVRTFIVERYRA